MDNLYNPITFCRAAFNHPMKILCHGIPTEVIQAEVLGRKEQLHVRGIYYTKVCDKEGIPKNERLSHIDFRCFSAMAWINEDGLIEEWEARYETYRKKIFSEAM